MYAIDYESLERARAKDRVKARTRQFAKRQCTWFRSLPECREVALTSPFDAEAVAQQIYEMGNTR